MCFSSDYLYCQTHQVLLPYSDILLQSEADGSLNIQQNNNILIFFKIQIEFTINKRHEL